MSPSDRRPPSAGLRVAMVVRTFPTVSETFILRQVTGLMDLGHEVTVMSDRRPEPGPVHGDFERYDLVRRVVYVHGSRSPSRTGAEWKEGVAAAVRVLLRDPGSLRWLARNRSAPYGGRRNILPRLAALGRGRHDVVHCHFGDVGLEYAFLGEAWDAPLVVTFHGYDFSRYPDQHGPAVYRSLFERAACVTVNSEYARRRLLELGCPERLLRILHVGMDPAEFTFRERGPKPEREPVRILTVARLVEKKGVEYGLEAVARAVEAGLALRYEVIGDGPRRESLERRARELRLEGVVTFRGARPQVEVREAMRRADLFLLPSITAASGDQEGTPTVLMEASSCGLPILSTRHSGIPEVVLDGRSGYLVPERDVEALADVLLELLAAPGSWAELGRAGRRHVERHFDIGVLNRELEEIYRDVLSAGPAAAPRS